MTFIAIGNARASIIVAVVRKFVLVIPFIYILPHLFKSNQTLAIYASEPAADILAVSFTVIIFAAQFKKALKSKTSAPSYM